MRTVIEGYLQLRATITYLGQNDEQGWWNSSFLTPNGLAFMEYNFPRATHLAALNATVAAAKRFHDERIGSRRCNHLFRLSFADEIALQRTLLAGGGIVPGGFPISREDAMKRLQVMAKGIVAAQAGPQRVGDAILAFTAEGLGLLAANYLAGFQQGAACLPYFSNERS
jgi:hypothetical protein